MRWGVLVLVATAALMTGGLAHDKPVTGSDLVGLYNGGDATGSYAIGAVTKSPAGSWTEDVGNPILVVGSSGAWDDEHVKDPALIWDGSQFVVYYAGHDGSRFQVGRATADSIGGTWTKDGSNPVLSLGSGGAFDDTGLVFPVVLYEPTDPGREWKMWYGADDGSVQTVGYAYSSDGVSWTKHGQVISEGAPNSWSDVGVVPGAVYKAGGVYHLLVDGRQGTSLSRWQGGLWTFTDPEGTYTAHGSDPIMLARFNDSGTSQALTADTVTGSAVITVADTSAWNVGEPMAVSDTDSETLISEIASIDSATQVTLSDNAAYDYATGNAATIRPLAYNSITPSTLRPNPTGGWECYVSAFQPVDDLTVGGVALREGSMRMTAEDISGPWSYDYDTGLMIPLAAEGSGWDAISAENMSVIPTP